MKKTNKSRLTAAVFLVVLGCTILGVVMTMMNWDFSKLSTQKFVTNTHEITESFKNISITTDTADIIFEKSDDGACRVECYEQAKAIHSVKVLDHTLVVELVNKKSWYHFIGFSFTSPKIKVYLPGEQYGDLLAQTDTGDIEIKRSFQFDSLDVSADTGDVSITSSALGMMKVKTNTGDIRVENASAGTMQLSLSTGMLSAANVTCSGDMSTKISTGKTELTDIRCKNLTSDGNTGDLSLRNVVASEKFNLERNTGDIKLLGADAAEIFAETNTGDIVGNLFSSKIFVVRNDTGDIDVPKSLTGGLCELITDTGDIEISITPS